jgi:GAF domain-containing protein
LSILEHAWLRPSNSEELRQAAVYASGVLAMRENPRLQSIAERTAALLSLPIAAISISDGARQWFPVELGLNAQEARREGSFCDCTIAQPDRILVVEDAVKEPRFAASPLVTEAPHIRFYVGVPIVTPEGAALGTICAAGPEPKSAPTQGEQATLRSFAREVLEEIEAAGNLREFGHGAVDQIVDQIRHAARQENEALVLTLDKVLQKLEARLRSAGLPM